MKTKHLFFALFAVYALSVSAQEGYSSYLNKALEKLDAGECESAQKLYNAYKELSGRSVTSVEVLIADCSSAKGMNTKSYKVNDKIIIKGDIYKVAYVEDEGKHGFAVCEYGSSKFEEKWNEGRLIPTESEFKLMAGNNATLHFNGRYWSTRIDGSSVWCYGLGSYSGSWQAKNNTNSVMFIHRF